MGRLEFLVQGSSPEPYRVIVEKSESNLNGFCTCAAGANGQACKHLMQILSGNPDGLLDECVGKLVDAVNWTANTDVEMALQQLALAEDHLIAAKKALSSAKKNLSAALRK